MLILIKRHHTGAAHQLMAHRNFFNIMARKLNVVITAPIIYPLCKIIQHKPLHCLPVFVAESTVPICLYKQKANIVQDIPTVLGTEIIRHHCGIRCVPPLILGFIGKKSHNLFGKRFSKTSFILFVR